MMCLVIDLHLPDGKSERCRVVEIDSGLVLSVTDFENECHSMLLVNEAYLMPVSDEGAGNTTGMQAFYRYDGRPACLYVRTADGELTPFTSSLCGGTRCR